MSPRVDPVNRIVVALVAVLLVAAGVLGLLLGAGTFGDPPQLLPPEVRDVAAGRPWFWWTVAGACVLVVLLALWWLFAQLRTDRVGKVGLTVDDRDGLTVLDAGALTAAVEEEVEALRGVSGASAHLRDSGIRRLALTVELTDYADVAEIRTALVDVVVARARQAVGDPELLVDIELRPSASRSRSRGLR